MLKWYGFPPMAQTVNVTGIFHSSVSSCSLVGDALCRRLGDTAIRDIQYYTVSIVNELVLVRE